MSKAKISFFCQNCGYESVKWAGQCPSCGQWNTFVEELVKKENNKAENQDWNNYKEEKREAKTILLSGVIAREEKRILSADPELNRVLGGGIVPGSLVLVAGEPGIGKSTLFLQNGLWLKNIPVLYISGEESEQQIKMRADRLQLQNDQFYLLTEISTTIIFQEIKKIRPGLVIVDSIQTLASPFIDSSPGSVSQIRECAAEFQRFAKETGVPVILIGHITKDGSIAGPKILEHMVDTVLQFEGDRHYAYRILRTLKNRFGSTAELGIYEMTDMGMKAVLNPSEILITQKEEQLSGIAIAATIEGIRPLLIEVQALVTQSVYGTPQRTVTGFDLRRLQLLLAVLEKRGGFHFGMKDVFLNIAGGFKVEDPSIDLAVLCALLSSYEDVPLPLHLCFAGEIGLSGEIRAVNRVDQRIAEAEKLGFEKIIVSKYNRASGQAGQKGKQKGAKGGSGIEVVAMGRVEEVYKYLFLMIALTEIKDAVLHLLFPHVCAGCGSDNLGSENQLCLRCLGSIPETNFESYPGNPVENSFIGRLPVLAASAQFFFAKESLVQQLMHQFKYRGNKELGLQLGRIMGEQLCKSGRFPVDALIPLPLFPAREKKRGYNQAMVLCQGIAEFMNLPLLNNVVSRPSHTETQTRKGRIERWKNIEGKFVLERPDLIKNKHILLVDDVITTGATLESCGAQLLKAEGCSLSIACLCMASR